MSVKSGLETDGERERSCFSIKVYPSFCTAESCLFFFFVLSTSIICPGKEVPNINEEVEHRTYIGCYNHRSCSASVNLN